MENQLKHSFEKWKRDGLVALLTLNLVFAVTYFALAKLGLTLATLSKSASPVWPVTGFAISILYLFGPRVSIAVFFGAFAANSLLGTSLMTTFAISIGNTLEAIVGAWILRKVLSLEEKFSDQTETVAFLTSAAVGSFVSASIGVIALLASNSIDSEIARSVWLTWWIGDALGGVVLAPLILKFRKFRIESKDWKHLAGVLVLLLASTYLVFLTSFGGPLLFCVFPALLYATRKLPKPTTLLASALVCALSIAATVEGYGPFAAGDLNERLIHLQLFLGAYSLTALTLVGFGREVLTRTSAVVLLICWALSGSIFYSFDRSERNKTHTRITNLVEDAQEKTVALMTSYDEVLLGGVALFAASKNVEFSEWRAFNEALEIEALHPGMYGLGVVWPVKPDKLADFEKELRKQGLARFTIHSLPGFEDQTRHVDGFHFINKYIEPAESNQSAIGLDISGDPVRTAAALTARDTGQGTITSKLVLVQDNTKSPGVLYFRPIYNSALTPATVEQRRELHIGWVTSPFTYQKFFAEAFAQATDEVEVRVYEGKEPEIENLVFSNFSSKHNPVERTTDLKLGQRDFTMAWRRSPKFISSHNVIVAWVGFLGALASLFLTYLMVTTQRIGQRSREIAENLTRELSASREKFQQGERRLLYALDGSDDGIWDWNIVSFEMYVSGKIAATHGWPQTFRVETAEDLSIFAHPADLEKISASIQAVLSGRMESHEVETRYLTTNGDWKWVLTRGKVSERDPNGKPTRMTGVHLDIDALKRAQTALEDTKYNLQNIANNMPVNISLWNSAFGCEFANRGFCDWFVTPYDSIVGKHMTEILSADVFHDRLPIFNRVLKGEALTYEREVIRPSDGESRIIIAGYLPNQKHGELDGFFNFMQDITDLKRAEIHALEGQKVAIEAAGVKAQFLANMSHEIRTPINGIIGMTKLLSKTGLDEKQKDYAEVIGRSSDALLNLVNDILDFSKVEAGKLELEEVDFSLKHMVNDMAKTFSFTAQEKDIQFESKMNLGTHEYYKGDPGRIRQVLTNLIANAIKFTSRGLVELNVKADHTGTQSALRFEISDTGIGISKAAIGRMFQAFTQADASTTRRFGGTGLGLSICKQLVNLMGGEIGVDSVEGEGSTFWFTLNLEQGEAKAKRVNERPAIESPGARLLVVEDNRVNQQIAIELLEILGYSPHAVGNGLEALDALHETKYDLILMDCQMPEMDGFQATEIIRKSESLDLRSIPIIAMTANALKGDRERCIEVGMDGYVTKPINELQLVTAIEAGLKKRTVPVFEVTTSRDQQNNEVIDMDTIDLLRALQQPGKPNVLNGLIQLFLETSAKETAQIREGVRENDLAKILAAAHSMKASSANLGALNLSSLCEKMEAIGKGKIDISEIPNTFKTLEVEYTKVCETLKSFISK